MKHIGQRMKLDVWTLTVATCGVGALFLLVRRISSYRDTNSKVLKAKMQRSEAKRQAEQAVRQYKDSHPNTDPPLILSLSLSELTKQLQGGSLSPEEVFYSYMEKALDVDKKVNCCTGVLLESLDQLKTVGSCKDGLLYGVPVSIKENVGYKNHDSLMGLMIALDQPVQKDCVIVEVLKKQGAIPFVKTNLPQGLITYDCGNPIFGQSLNPHNLQKTTGGSSGGEGGLIGGGGSILGIGTDVGGSIRIPASFCGICGFKPTGGRLSLQGVNVGFRGQRTVHSSPGPMAQDVDSLALCMQALLCDHMFSLDPTVPPLPFNMQVYQSSSSLRIGYCDNDSFTQPSPTMARALREVKALFERAGHTLVPYSPPRLSHAMNELIVKGILADGATTLLSRLRTETVDPSVAPQVFPYRFPHWMKRILSILIRPLFPRVADYLNAICGVRSVTDLWKHHYSVEEYIHETITEWRRCDIDVLLCPVIGPAFNLNYCAKLINALSSTMLYNLLNFPAGVVPIATVTAEDEAKLRHYRGNYHDPLDKIFKQAVTGGEGLPVAVQCVALPWQDELCLRFMKGVEQLVRQKRRLRTEKELTEEHHTSFHIVLLPDMP